MSVFEGARRRLGADEDDLYDGGQSDVEQYDTYSSYYDVNVSVNISMCARAWMCVCVCVCVCVHVCP